MTISIDVLLVTGYLGAGKSTLLKNLLQRPEITRLQPALIINEFGQQGIDGRLFDESGWPLFEINRGSLFCICTQTDLLNALARITDLKPGIVLVEATGVAETRDIESLMDEASLEGQFRVRGNICVVDALNFTKVAPFLKAARNQVAMADGIVVNKVDLVPAPQRVPLRQLFTAMNPRAVRDEVTRGGIEYSFVDRLSHQRATESLAAAQPDAVHARSFHSETPVDRTEFMQTITRLGSRLLRLKGHVLFSDQTAPQFVETVFDQVDVKPPVSNVKATAFTAI
ncbi:MAG: CobW family GTP-binding protein, partial [bacterium]